MPPHSGPVIALMALLALAGIQKIVDPRPTSGALRGARLPSSRQIVISLGLAEIGTGLSGVVIGGPIPALIALGFYAAFALFVGYALVRRLPINSCGCLGAVETPPSVVHVLINTAAAAMMLAAVFTPVDLVAGLTTLPVLEGIAFIVFTAGVVYLLYGALTVLPLLSKRLPTTSPVALTAPRERSR